MGEKWVNAVLPSLYTGENQGSWLMNERLMNLSTMAESVSGIAGTWRLRYPTPKSGDYLETNATIKK